MNFTQDDYKKSLEPKAVAEAKVPAVETLKTDLLAELDSFLRDNKKIPASSPPVTSVVSPGESAHNKCVAAAEKMHESISNTANDVNELTRIVNAAKIDKSTLNYSECLATCETLCKKAENELKATAPSSHSP